MTIIYYEKTVLPPKGNINLYGARGSGKTALVLDYLAGRSEERPLSTSTWKTPISS